MVFTQYVKLDFPDQADIFFFFVSYFITRHSQFVLWRFDLYKNNNIKKTNKQNNKTTKWIVVEFKELHKITEISRIKL